MSSMTRRALGSIALLDGLYMACWRVIAQQIPSCRTELSAVFKSWLDAPVVVAAWEAGFDQTLFPGQLAHDPAEPLDGIDNDGNGVIDDTNGPTCDTHLKPVAESIPSPSACLVDRLGLPRPLDLKQMRSTPRLRLGEAGAWTDS